MQKGVHEKINAQEKSHREALVIKSSILKTLAYFDIFEYPLQKVEISQFMDQPVPAPALDLTLSQLLDEKHIFLFNNFYSLRDNTFLSSRRILGNARADKLLPKALKIGKFLCRFPYVRSIAISGSLSKHFADAKADIDYFIVTKRNRLWIARTLMHFYKKFTFLTGRQHFYCMNYFVDEAALEVNNKNIFTAMEVKTLIPAAGPETMEQFFKVNAWADRFLPSLALCGSQEISSGKSWIKRFFEWCFNNQAGDRLDNYLEKITGNRWKKKKTKGKRNLKGQTMDLITGRHFAWSNPESFQEKVLVQYEQKLEVLRSAMPECFEELRTSFAV